MNSASPLIGHRQLYSGTPRAQDYIPSICWLDRARHGHWVVVCFVDLREGIFDRRRKEASVQSQFHITIIRGDRMVDGDQVSSCLKSALYLHLRERAYDGWVYMSATQYSLPKRHEFGHGVILVANEPFDC